MKTTEVWPEPLDPPVCMIVITTSRHAALRRDCLYPLARPSVRPRKPRAWPHIFFRLLLLYTPCPKKGRHQTHGRNSVIS